MMVTEERKKDAGQGPGIQTLHDRARESALELRKLLIGLASGAIAVCYLALSSPIDPPLNQEQQWVATLSLVLLGCSVAGGLLQWRADIKRNYFWAKALSPDPGEKGQKYWYAKRDSWLRVRRVSGTAMRSTFLFGMIGCVVFGILRISSQ